jgi:hypothetical protein
MAGKREASWIKAKQTFVTLLLKEYPGQIGRQRIVAPIIDKADPNIVKFLKTCDVLDLKASPELSKANVDSKAAAVMLNDFEKAAAEFRKFSTELTNNIQGEIGRLKAADNPNPKAKENAIRALKVLKTELGSLDNSNESWLAITRTGLEARTKQMSAYEQMGKDWGVVLKAALARALAAAQRVKADPKPSTYNKEFPKAARDITQQIGNVKKLADKGVKVPGPADPKPLFARLEPFANGDLMSLVEKTTTNEQVLAAITAFNKAVKAVFDVYKGHI